MYTTNVNADDTTCECIDKWITNITICICFQHSILQIPYAESTWLSLAANLTIEAASLRLDIAEVTDDDGDDGQSADPGVTDPMEVEEAASLPLPAVPMEVEEDISLLLPAVALPVPLEERYACSQFIHYILYTSIILNL